ncbi:MAG: hypothetical protein Ct9H90mP13_00220 [Pseudomonadota bacterium]|nr:MAG: hypothetical protein Ct9H90mP13_00220 [Pseudomonadota bacterium]
MVPNQEWKRNNFKSKENQNWYLGETVIAGIGQGYMLATPMQLAYANLSLQIEDLHLNLIFKTN